MILSDFPALIPTWPLPKNARALITTRNGGLSQGAYSSFNLALHVEDDPATVLLNRERLQNYLRRVAPGVCPAPLWLDQVHGTQVVNASASLLSSTPLQADAIFSREAGQVCLVMTADCLPVLFCDTAGSVVAAAHAGWRGLLNGILEETIRKMNVPGRNLLAYLGPAIGATAFEVGDEVHSAFVLADKNAQSAFKAVEGSTAKWQADLYALAALRLKTCGVEQIFGGSYCTASDEERFFSYRRDGQTGRMASMIWLES